MNPTVVTTIVRRIRPPSGTLLAALVTTKASTIAYWDCFEVSILIQPQYQLALTNNASLTVTVPSPSSSASSSDTTVNTLLIELTNPEYLTKYLQGFYTSLVFRPEASLLSLYYNSLRNMVDSTTEETKSGSSDSSTHSHANPSRLRSSFSETLSSWSSSPHSYRKSRRRNIFPSLEQILEHPFHIGDQLGPFTVAHRGYIRTTPDYRSDESSSVKHIPPQNHHQYHQNDSHGSSAAVTMEERNGIEAVLTWDIGTYSGYSYHAIIANQDSSNPIRNGRNNLSPFSSSSDRATTATIPRLTFIFGTALWNKNHHHHHSNHPSSPNLNGSSSSGIHRYRQRMNRLLYLQDIVSSILLGGYTRNNKSTTITTDTDGDTNGILLSRPLPPYDNVDELIDRKLYPSPLITTKKGKPWGSQWLWGPFHRGYSRLLLISAVDRHLRRNLL